MELNDLDQLKKPQMKTSTRIIVCVAILLFGLIGMKLLASLKKPPSEAKKSENVIQVEVTQVSHDDYPVSITGYGEAGSLNIVPVAPEVSGKIIKIHPRLEAGEVLSKGELLFRIDPRDYQIVYKTGSERLKNLERNRELALKEFERVKQLFEKNKVGTLSGVDAAEKAYLSAADITSQVEQSVKTAQINLERCDVRMQFDGRVEDVALEKGQYVAPGQKLLTLVDDSVLEIHVPLDSRDARNWLRFENRNVKKTSVWFSGIKQVPCEIRWTENTAGQVWKGRLHRVVRFDKQTRTLTVAIRADRKNSDMGKDTLPLVDGMFCSVAIPGKMMRQVIRLPRWAVSFENTVYTAVENRLKTVSVHVVRAEGDYVYLNGELNDGDQVITTRLVDPLENSLLNITSKQEAGGES